MGTVLVEDDIKGPVELIFDRPVTADSMGKLTDIKDLRKFCGTAFTPYRRAYRPNLLGEM